MRNRLFLCVLLLACLDLSAQNPTKIYKIAADSVLLNYCDSTELIIMNHTQNVPGFLFNTGSGRTVFQRGAIRLNDSMYVIGADTVTLPQRALDYWSLNGNYNTAANGQFIGTNDGDPLVFHVSGAARLWLAGAGTLGLNTYGPQYDWAMVVQPTFTNLNYGFASGGKFNMLGDIAFTQNANAGVIADCGIRCDGQSGMFFQGPPTVNGDMFVFKSNAGNGSLYDDYLRNPTNGSNVATIRILSGVHEANIGGSEATSLYIQPTYALDTVSWPVKIRGIYYNPVVGNLMDSRHIAIETVSGDVLLGTSSGNTGIGTNSPTAQLHTTGTVRFAGLTPDSTQTRVVVADDSGNLYYRSAASLAANDVIRSSLAVNGAITAKKLTLEAKDWADYVFDSTYRLQDLATVEALLRKEHHLPGIPSAGDVARDGIDVGANQAALLKKIEELTLYSIEQEKELRLLKEQMVELKTMIAKK